MRASKKIKIKPIDDEQIENKEKLTIQKLDDDENSIHNILPWRGTYNFYSVESSIITPSLIAFISDMEAFDKLTFRADS
jgi:hypothetical protein